jgi:uncharacterized membrane protein YhhN
MPGWVAFLTAAALVAAIDWWAVSCGRRPIELWAKPLAMALLVGVAATAGDLDGSTRAWLVVGAVLGLVGDVALLGDSEQRFMAGLTAFAVGHLAYAVAALTIEFDPVWALPGLVAIVALLSIRFVTRTIPGARAHGGGPLGASLVVYAVVIAAMVVTAWGTQAWLAGAGALAFAFSDWVLGQQLFAEPPERLLRHRLAVMVPYHVGQALLIVGLARA